MNTLPLCARKNVHEHDGQISIRATPGVGRYATSSILGALFFALLVSLLWPLFRIFGGAGGESDHVSLLIVGPLVLLLAFLTFVNLKEIVKITEVLLVPEKRKIIIRRERSKKVLSEHSLDDIQFQHEVLSQDDPSTPGMYWFVLYDTKLKKQLFAIRPGESQSEDAMAVEELEELFKEIMFPEKHAHQRPH